jgi:hypothetical protein
MQYTVICEFIVPLVLLQIVQVSLPLVQSSGGEMMVVDYMSVLRDEGLRLGTKQAQEVEAWDFVVVSPATHTMQASKPHFQETM